MVSEGSLQRDQGCTVLVFGIPASGKSALISRLTKMWRRTVGNLNVSLVSDNSLLQALERGGALGACQSTHKDEFLLTPEIRRYVAATTAKDVGAESRTRRIAVMELATFEWQTVQDNLRLPPGRKCYAIYLYCSREVSLLRQHNRASTGIFNAILPLNIMDSFMETESPRRWLADYSDSYWEFDTGVASIEDIVQELGELKGYGAKIGDVRQLYASENIILDASTVPSE